MCTVYMYMNMYVYSYRLHMHNCIHTLHVYPHSKRETVQLATDDTSNNNTTNVDNSCNTNSL